MANCKECLLEKVCRYNDGHNLYCKECYECPHHKNKSDFIATKRAKWIYETRYYSCSFCGGKRFDLLLGTDAEYCPYCGAKMDGERRCEE
jgi:DNA-directed RNA polymerase subunit RPC12/RpoP